MDFDRLEITEIDIEAIKELTSSPIIVSDLTSNSRFSKIEDIFKLVTVLSVMRRYDDISEIMSYFQHQERILESSQLEIALDSIANGNKFNHDSFCQNVRRCVKFFEVEGSLNTKKNIEWNRTDILLRIRTLQYLVVTQKFKKAKEILSGMTRDEKQYFLNFFSSLLSFQSQYLRRLRPNAKLSLWIEASIFLEKTIADIPREVFSQLKINTAYALSTLNRLDEAIKLARSVGTNDRLKFYISMKKALQGKEMKKAVFFADRLILSSNVQNQLEADFDRETAEKALKRANEILRKAGLDVFIISGTLLGCVREGRIFEHDKDFDLGIMGWESQFDVATAFMLSKEFKVDPSDLRGNKLFLLPVKHRATGFSFDVFFFHEKVDHFLHGIDSRLGHTFNFKFSKFGLTTHKFLGEDFLIPDNYDLMLVENYGPDWRTPNPNYFVKLESPALLKKSGSTFAFCIRHEMLQLMQKGGSFEKVDALNRCIENVADQSSKPNKKIMNHFNNAFTF